MAATHTEPREPWPVLVRSADGWAKAMVHLIIDYGFEHDLCFVCFLDDSRECWTVRNQDIRAPDNITAGRPPNGASDAD